MADQQNSADSDSRNPSSNYRFKTKPADHPEVAALKGWRETRRPSQCAHTAPCWVDDPYAAVPNGPSHNVYCLGCKGRPTFDGEALRQFLAERGERAP